MVVVAVSLEGLLFQSTHSRGVRRHRLRLFAGPGRFQSTHSRGVRLEHPQPSRHRKSISIHALTRSATPKQPPSWPASCHFNPRTHEECDIIDPVNPDVIPIISIHALTRSATAIRFFQNNRIQISIHALTRSATSSTVSPVRSAIFQSTHSRGVRRIKEENRWTHYKFQSTHSRGVRRFSGRQSVRSRLLFQSTHSRGVRRFVPDG